MDRWDGQAWRRVLILDGQPVKLCVRQVRGGAQPELRAEVRGDGAGSQWEAYCRGVIGQVLGTDLDLGGFYRLSSAHPGLAALAEPFRGMRPPRFPDSFEALANAITCQQLSLTVGILLLNRLTAAYGVPLQEGEEAPRAFPRPQDLLDADPHELRAMGYSYQKAGYLLNLARSLAQGELDLTEVGQLTDADAVKKLCEIKGIGRWSAEYYLLRGLGRTSVFPGDDVGARNNLQRWLAIADPLNYGQVQDTLRGWKDYGGLIYFHLLLKSLQEKGLIED